MACTDHFFSRNSDLNIHHFNTDAGHETKAASTAEEGLHELYQIESPM